MIKSVLPTQILKAFLGTTKDVSELKLNLKSTKYEFIMKTLSKIIDSDTNQNEDWENEKKFI